MLNSVLPTKWVATVLGALLLLLAAYLKGRSSGMGIVEAEWNKERLAQAQAVQQATEQARAAEREATERIRRAKERTHEQLASIDRRHRADLERLRERADRGEGDVSSDPGTSLAGTPAPRLAGRDVGAGLAEWLLTYAADAARLEASYQACADQYAAVKKMGDK